MTKFDFLFSGLHEFGGGSDWGGKFVSIGMGTWVKVFLDLDPEDEIITALINLGNMVLSKDIDVTDSLPSILRPLETLVCKAST